MKRLLVGFIIGLVALSSGSALAGDKLVIDAGASTVDWLGKKITGQHRGKVGIKGGHVVFEGAALKSATIEIDLTTLTCVDIESPKWNAKLVNHLKSDDFFSVEKYPIATFVLKKSSAKKEGTYRLEGDLRMKGKTHPISFELKVARVGPKIKATGKVVLDRTTWGIKYNSGKFFPSIGDKLIYDDFELTLSLVTK